MSGGVDSSTVAAMLVRDGYDVVGITLQLYDVNEVGVKQKTCCAGIDIYDAKRVSEKLGIPHYVLNYETNFKESVIDKFVDTYLKGETPIPCVTCNQTVKFSDLFAVAKKLGAKFLATGHYVQKKYGKDGAELHRGVDETKDQSYFLFATTQEQLDFLEFPIGGLKKNETRELAKSLGIEIFDKKDSQDICFVPNGDYARIIEKFRPGALDKGVIKDTKGNVLGEHNGIINYTVGQRKGLGVSSQNPYYVIKINAEDNSVIVGEEHELERTTFTIRNLNWLGDKTILDGDAEVFVKIRSAHKGSKALIKQSKVSEEYQVILLESQKSISPGQACVVYKDTRVLGGGWITAK
jgi:tRNA-specific 2-thiouridylase